MAVTIPRQVHPETRRNHRVLSSCWSLTQQLRSYPMENPNAIDSVIVTRRLWNKGKLIGAKPPLRAPSCGFAARLDASLGLVGAHEAESEAADDSHVAGTIAGAVARQIIAEFDIE